MARDPRTGIEMTSRVQAELDAMRNATELVARTLEYDIIEYVRSKGIWYVQVITQDGPRTFDYELMVNAAEKIRKGELRKAEEETNDDQFEFEDEDGGIADTVRENRNGEAS